MQYLRSTKGLLGLLTLVAILVLGMVILLAEVWPAGLGH